jgi:hypothetical protein
LKKYLDYLVSGKLYYGYLDMACISIVPKYLKERGLKISIDFVYDQCQFIVWLSGLNKKVQTKDWKVIEESGWNTFHLASDPTSLDSIVGQVLIADLDFRDIKGLTNHKEGGIVDFIKDVKEFLCKQHKWEHNKSRIVLAFLDDMQYLLTKKPSR